MPGLRFGWTALLDRFLQTLESGSEGMSQWLT
jgi:hypothetical protein